MLVYRITKRKYASDIKGTGAALYPGRWNKKGTPVLYTGGTKEIALLEFLVHAPPLLLPCLDILTLETPDDSITVINPDDLPLNWDQYPPPSILAEIGESWRRGGQTVALGVPSCIIHTSVNYILNCSHKDFAQVRVVSQEPFKLDSRLGMK